MLDNLESILQNECNLVKDRAIIVGVSGGPDSLCLMEVLRQAGYSIVVAHFNHQLRPEAGQDALAVEQTASRLRLTSRMGGADVRLHALQEKLSIEEAARDLRYRFLFALARERNAQAVAVGHTADDQVETVLMHFLRGSGLAGLKGMPYLSVIKTFDPDIPIVRPLLDVSREATLAYCAAQALEPHYDSSNDSLAFQRNRIRHLLIPNLETYNPNFRKALLRMTQSLKDDHTFLKEMLETAWQEVVNDLGEEVVIFDSLLTRRSIGLQRNLIKRAMQHLCPELDVNFAAIERACNFIKDPPLNHRVDLNGGLRMLREGNNIYICTFDAVLSIDQWPQISGVESMPVPVPGQIDLSGEWKFTCERRRIPAPAREQAERNRDQFQVWLDADRLPASLELRIRLPGDHMEPLGMEGHSQKISDLMVNEKMPKRARARWPLLCSGKTIIWVPGYRPAHPFRLTEATNNILYFSVARPADKSVE